MYIVAIFIELKFSSNYYLYWGQVLSNESISALWRVHYIMEQNEALGYAT